TAGRQWRDGLRLAGAAVKTVEAAEGVSTINNVRIAGIRRDVSALARAHRVPIAKRDGTEIAAARGGNPAAVPLRAVNAIGKLVINRNVIELGCGLVVPRTPGLSAIHAYAGALIAAKNHALRIGRINPERVVIVAAGSAFKRLKIFSTIR